MLISSNCRLPRLASPAISIASSFSSNSTTTTPPAEPGYAGYLSNAVSNVISSWSSWNSVQSTPEQNHSPIGQGARKIVLKESRAEVTARTNALVQKLLMAESPSVRRLKELCNHVQAHPATRLAAVQEPQIISLLLKLEASAADESVQREARLCLSLLGYVRPPKNRGINLLTIDGGGTRGMMGLEILEAIENAAGGKKVHELFDHIVGVSTGAIIAVMLGIKKLSVRDCRQVYLDISRQLFNQNRLTGAKGLLLNHSYYDTKKWVAILKEILGEDSMGSSARETATPYVSVVSSIINLPELKPYIFRNYGHPAGHDAHYRGGTEYAMWQAVQASAAAPGYFEEVVLGNILHQDGGVIANNPTAIGVHEVKTLWPKQKEDISCLVSVGNGRSVQELEESPLFKVSSTRHKILKIIDSATDTEGVHMQTRDLLSHEVYYRLNPYMTHPYGLDEINPDRLEQMDMDAKLYVRRNWMMIEAAAKRLTLPPTPIQRVKRGFQSLLDRNGYYKPV